MEKYLLQEKVETKQIVAIKIIHLDQPPEDPEDVQKELNFLKTCDSQHIIKYYETILKDDTLYMVMEYMNPGSLKDYLQKIGPISETYISMILREMLLGLEYLQSERKCHRNLKASNVLLSEKGEVKLCDLVVGGTLGDATRLESVARAPYWIAPEVMSGNPKVEKLDKQDIWSIGITAYEIATGVPPYHDHEPMKMNLLLAREDPPRLEGEFSRSFKDFVNLCLSKEVKKRPTIKDLLAHPFIRKSKKIYNLLDMVGKLSRQHHRLSQRIEPTAPAIAPSAKRARAFSTNSITGRIRSDTGSDDSGSELGGTLSFGSPPSTSGSPQGSPTVFDTAVSTTKIGVTMSRLKNASHDSAKFISITTASTSPAASPTTTTPTTPTLPVPTTPTATTPTNATTTTTTTTTSSAFTPTNPSAPAFSPTINAIPPSPGITATTTTESKASDASAIPNVDSTTPKMTSDESASKMVFEAKPLEISSMLSSPTPSLTVTNPIPVVPTTASAIPTITTSPPVEASAPTPISPNSTPITTPIATPIATPLATPASTPMSTLSPTPISAPTTITTTTTTTSNSNLTSSLLSASASNENINEADFQSFVSPISPPVTPKIKPPLLTTPPTSSFLDSVILPVLAKKGRAPTEEGQAVLHDLRDAFKRLEACQIGASQQLINDWVEAVLWENYSQQERGSPMANYLLLRWKNATPL